MLYRGRIFIQFLLGCDESILPSIITINGRVDYMVQVETLSMQVNHITMEIGRDRPENQEFFGP